MSVTRQPVWDLPIRLFHWTLAALIVFSWWSAENHHLDWHLYSGLGILSLLIFRFLWGVVGSSTARFASFVRGPAGTLAYLRDPSRWTAAGHTPLSALSIIAMLGAIGAQVFLGLFSVDEDGLFEGPLAQFISYATSDMLRDIHEKWFWAIVALIALHVGAIIFYRVAKGKHLAKAMVTGKNDLDSESPPMRPGKWWVAVLCLVAGIAITRWIIAGLPPFG